MPYSSYNNLPFYVFYSILLFVFLLVARCTCRQHYVYLHVLLILSSSALSRGTIILIRCLSGLTGDGMTHYGCHTFISPFWLSLFFSLVYWTARFMNVHRCTVYLQLINSLFSFQLYILCSLGGGKKYRYVYVQYILHEIQTSIRSPFFKYTKMFSVGFLLSVYVIY